MTLQTFYDIFLVSLAFPATIAFFAREKFDYRFRPIMIFLCIIFIWEFFRENKSGSAFLDSVASNSQGLLETLALCWVAYRWKIFEKGPLLYFIIPLLVIAAWSADKMINGFGQPFSWVNTAFSALNICLSVLFLTRTLYKPAEPFLKNPVYLFGAAILVHFSLAALLEGSYLVINSSDYTFMLYAFYAGIIGGIITNLIYLKTVVCILKSAKSS
jgi:hypothetical protein